MPMYFAKYTEGFPLREANLHDKNCDKNRGWYRNQYIDVTGTEINNRKKN